MKLQWFIVCDIIFLKYYTYRKELNDFRNVVAPYCICYKLVLHVVFSKITHRHKSTHVVLRWCSIPCSASPILHSTCKKQLIFPSSSFLAQIENSIAKESYSHLLDVKGHWSWCIPYTYHIWEPNEEFTIPCTSWTREIIKRDPFVTMSYSQDCG